MASLARLQTQEPMEAQKIDIELTAALGSKLTSDLTEH